MPKLSTIGPVYERGIWSCKGRLAKGLENLLGKKNLPILTRKGRLAELMMIAAHEKNHEGVAGTLAASRALVWILKGRYLARKVVQKCVYCRAKKHKLQTQQMGAGVHKVHTSPNLFLTRVKITYLRTAGIYHDIFCSHGRLFTFP